MSTTVELRLANERYERLRAAVEELARLWDRSGLVGERECAIELRAAVGNA